MVSCHGLILVTVFWVIVFCQKLLAFPTNEHLRAPALKGKEGWKEEMNCAMCLQPCLALPSPVSTLPEGSAGMCHIFSCHNLRQGGPYFGAVTTLEEDISSWKYKRNIGDASGIFDSCSTAYMHTYKRKWEMQRCHYSQGNVLHHLQWLNYDWRCMQSLSPLAGVFPAQKLEC